MLQSETIPSATAAVEEALFKCTADAAVLWHHELLEQTPSCMNVVSSYSTGRRCSSSSSAAAVVVTASKTVTTREASSVNSKITMVIETTTTTNSVTGKATEVTRIVSASGTAI